MMTNWTRAAHPALLFCALSYTAVPASAQPANAAAAEKSLVAPANLTFGAAPTSGGSVQFLLDASQDEKTGTVAFGWRDGQGSLQFSVTGPLAGNRATPVSLTGLSDAAIAKVSFSRLNWRGPTPVEQLEILRICEAAHLQVDDCDYRKGKLPALAANAVRQLQHLDDRPWYVSFDGSVGRTSFDFVSGADLAPGNETHDSWSGTARVGYFSVPYGFLFASYTYKRAFGTGGDSKQICTPLSSTGALECADRVVGAPALSKASVATLELRRFFSTNAAITPSVQYDFERDITAWEFPVYFIRAEKFGLSGGVKLAWRSDSRKTTAVVFIGTAVSLLPK
jgi:hypothetical protein